MLQLFFFKIKTNLLTVIFIVNSKKMNEIVKKKISKKLQGRKKLATTKCRISKSMKGKKKSKEHKENISKSMKEYYNKKKNRI